MKIKNYQVLPLIQLLHSLTLKGRVSLHRTKFIDILVNHNNEYIVNGIESIKNDYPEYNEEYIKEENEFLNENFIMELNEPNKVILISISEILLEGEFDISSEVAYHYADWCEEADKVLEYYKNV